MQDKVEAANPIVASKVEITPGRMRVLVELANDTPKLTDDTIASAALSKYPTLSAHSCINSQGPTFGAVIRSTSIPHLLEHIVIAEQIERAEKADFKDASFVGTTQWTNPDLRTQAIIELSFVDDMQAVSSLGAALDFLNNLLG